jgi:hypothetical protein
MRKLFILPTKHIIFNNNFFKLLILNLFSEFVLFFNSYVIIQKNMTSNLICNNSEYLIKFDPDIYVENLHDSNKISAEISTD